jgi:hypothetical protein
MQAQRKRASAQLKPANVQGLLIVSASVVVIVVAYLIYDRSRLACDGIFDQTAAHVSAKISALQTAADVTIGREQVQALSDGSQKVALHLKACCVAQIDGHISPAQLQTCIDGAKTYEASVVQAAAALQEAQAAHQQGNNQLAQERSAQAAQSVGAATTAAQQLGQVAADVTQPPASSPSSSGPSPSPVASQQGEIDLLAPAQGGHLLAAPSAGWEKVISGNEADTVTVSGGDAGVFSFLDDKPAQFWKFALLVPGSDSANIKDFELFAGNDTVTGSFQSIGKFTVQNLLLVRTPYQEFNFPKTTAKYFEIKVFTTYN